MILTPPMEQQNTADENAVWVGDVDIANLTNDTRITLADGEGYSSARILVRSNGHLLGFRSLPVVNGALPDDFASSVLREECARAPFVDEEYPFFTVAICTRNRTETLRDALESLKNLDYPNYEVLIVDNAPDTDETFQMVSEHNGEVGYVVELKAGISPARNTGIERARGEYIAFTDDDVVVDPYWLKSLLAAFRSNEDVACVTGLVPSGELATKTQRYFDSRVTWGEISEPAHYKIGEEYPNLPAFPFSVGAYGTGANFAMKRSLALRFDDALGAGRPPGGGEDIDFFFRVLKAGYAIAVAPDAIVWHRHRATPEALLSQSITYGRGLGAWLTKLILTPSVWPLLAQKTVAGVKRLGQLGHTEGSGEGSILIVLDEELDARMRSLEKKAMLSGPVSYLKGLLLKAS